MLKLALAALLLGAVSAAPLPKPPIYCPPVAYRDYEVLLGRSALIRPEPGCNRPSLLRKVSDISGEPGTPFQVPVPTVNTFLPRLWLFVSHLEYSLDGRTWQFLRLLP
ncbi:hypothetical protein [Deinococcus sp. UYEF24]